MLQIQTNRIFWNSSGAPSIHLLVQVSSYKVNDFVNLSGQCDCNLGMCLGGNVLFEDELEIGLYLNAEV